MKKTPREYELLATQSSITASQNPTKIKSLDYKQEASLLYEAAGDAWIVQATQKENSNNQMSFLNNAIIDYQHAISLTAKQEKKNSLTNKINSLNRKITDLSVKKKI